MKNTLVITGGIAVAIFVAASLILTGYGQAVNAKASANANFVAHAANTNQVHMTSCKEIHTARECATGPGNNGEFTSNVAHITNKPPK